MKWKSRIRQIMYGFLFKHLRTNSTENKRHFNYFVMEVTFDMMVTSLFCKQAKSMNEWMNKLVQLTLTSQIYIQSGQNTIWLINNRIENRQNPPHQL